MFQTLGEQIGLAIYVPVCMLAIWKGTSTERFAGWAIALASAAAVLVEQRVQWNEPQYAVLAVDIALLLALLGLALRSNRSWTPFAAAFQLIAVFCHAVVVLDPRIEGSAYLMGIIGFGYAVLAALMAGVLSRPSPVDVTPVPPGTSDHRGFRPKLRAGVLASLSRWAVPCLFGLALVGGLASKLGMPAAPVGSEAEAPAGLLQTPLPIQTASANCEGGATCAEAGDCAKAKFYLEVCGVKRLDGDGDGIPCEKLCG